MLDVVYLAYEGADFHETFALLNAKGLHPVAIDEQNPDGALVYASGNTIRIRIAVPTEEVDDASRALRVRAGEAPEGALRPARRFERSALVFIICAALLVGGVAIGLSLTPDFPWFRAGWIAASLGIVILALRR